MKNCVCQAGGNIASYKKFGGCTLYSFSAKNILARHVLGHGPRSAFFPKLVFTFFSFEKLLTNAKNALPPVTPDYFFTAIPNLFSFFVQEKKRRRYGQVKWSANDVRVNACDVTSADTGNMTL